MVEQEEAFFLLRSQGCDRITASTLASWREMPQQEGSPLYQQLADFLQQWWSEGAAVPLQSSGSTGEPKIFDAAKKYMRASARLSCECLGLQQGDKVLLALPLQYIAAKMMIVRALVSGLMVRIRPASSHVLAHCGEGEYFDFAPLVPMQAACSSGADLSRIRTILLGGGAVPSEVEEKLQAHEGAVYASYGMTESLSHIALRRVNGASASAYYQALPGVSLELSEEGCLCVTAPHLGIEGMQTNDVAELRADGGLHILGRRDNIINSGGIKLQAELIESIIYQATGLVVVALAYPHPQLGQCLALLWEGAQEKLPELEKAIAEQLSPYQRPKIVRHIASLPRTISGKIARKGCLEAII